MSKRPVGHLQNLAILLLSLSAALLLLVVIPLELEGESGLTRLQNLLSGKQTSSAQAADLSAVAAPLNLVLTNDYGRRGELLTTTQADLAIQCGSLIREAAGSSGEAEAAAPDDLRRALQHQSLFMDFLFPMPVQVVAGWFGADFPDKLDVRCLAISAADEGTCSLFLWDGGEQLHRYATAVPASSLLEMLDSIDTNGASFACEAGPDYDALYPYTILPAQQVSLPTIGTSTPVEAISDERLLSVLGFNVHTNYRYPESNGTQVIVEYPRELRIQPDGTVVYTGDAESSAPLFTAPLSAEDGRLSADAAALAALRLANAVMPPELAGSGSFFLTGLEETADGWSVTMGVSAGGVPVYHANGSTAAEIHFTGGTITSFSLRCRCYTLAEKSYSLLPLAQAAAAVQDGSNTMLTTAYVDRGGETAIPTWLLH